MSRSLSLSLAAAFKAAVLCVASLPSHAAPVGLDGTIGAEWAGVTPVAVNYDPAAPTSNFGAPTNANHVVGYEIFTRADAQYLYVGLRTTGPGDSNGLGFANLYFSQLTSFTTGSSIGFEVNNDRAFKPGGACCFGDTAADLIRFATTTADDAVADIVEVAIDLSVFSANALGVTGYVPSPNAIGIRLNLSQSFGYSVAGGQAFYGDTRLGFVAMPQGTVPEPASLALAGLALAAGLGFTHRRRSRV